MKIRVKDIITNCRKCEVSINGKRFTLDSVPKELMGKLAKAWHLTAGVMYIETW